MQMICNPSSVVFSCKGSWVATYSKLCIYMVTITLIDNLGLMQNIGCIILDKVFKVLN